MEDLKLLASISFANDWWTLLLPALLMLIDILTGVVHAWATGHLKSYRMREGLGRKYGELMALISFELITVALELNRVLMTGMAAYIIFMELVSLFENLAKLGVPLPLFIKKALGIADSITKGNELSDETKKQIKDAIEASKKEG